MSRLFTTLWKGKRIHVTLAPDCDMDRESVRYRVNSYLEIIGNTKTRGYAKEAVQVSGLFDGVPSLICTLRKDPLYKGKVVPNSMGTYDDEAYLFVGHRRGYPTWAVVGESFIREHRPEWLKSLQETSDSSDCESSSSDGELSEEERKTPNYSEQRSIEFVPLSNERYHLIGVAMTAVFMGIVVVAVLHLVC